MKQPDTTTGVYLGACDVAAIVGKLESLRMAVSRLEDTPRIPAHLNDQLDEMHQRLNEIDRVIAHAQQQSEPPPLTQERIAELGKEWGKNWGETP